MKINKKQQVINALKGNFEVIQIKKIYGSDGDELQLECSFTYKGRGGSFTYTLLGQERGIDECNFEEQGDEDIYGEIHEWIGEHIWFDTIVKCDGKELKTKY